MFDTVGDGNDTVTVNGQHAARARLSAGFPLSARARPLAGEGAVGRRAQPPAAGAAVHAAGERAGARRADQRSRSRDARAARGASSSTGRARCCSSATTARSSTTSSRARWSSKATAASRSTSAATRTGCGSELGRTTALRSVTVEGFGQRLGVEPDRQEETAPSRNNASSMNCRAASNGWSPNRKRFSPGSPHRTSTRSPLTRLRPRFRA